MNKTGILLLFMLCVCPVCSCGRKPGITLWEDYSYVFDRNGRTDFVLDNTKDKYVYYIDGENMDGHWYLEWFEKGPVSGIDSLVDSGRWQFVTYLHAPLKDTTKIVSAMKKYGYAYPVIIDPDDMFWNLNPPKMYFRYGVVCHKDGTVLQLNRPATYVNDGKSFRSLYWVAILKR